MRIVHRRPRITAIVGWGVILSLSLLADLGCRRESASPAATPIPKDKPSTPPEGRVIEPPANASAAALASAGPTATDPPRP